jgi:hypothetical protein
VIAPIFSLSDFPIGAGAGGVLDRRLGDRHPRHMATALCIEVSLIAAVAVLTMVLKVRPATVAGDTVIALLARPAPAERALRAGSPPCWRCSRARCPGAAAQTSLTRALAPAARWHC